MPPDDCWSRFFLFSDVGVGLLVCESNSCACGQWQWFTNILCRLLGKVERIKWKLKDLRSRPHKFPDTLHEKVLFVPNLDNVLLLESNKLTKIKLQAYFTDAASISHYP